MNFTDQLCTLPLERLKEIVRRRAFQIRSAPRITTKRELCSWLAQTLSDAYAVRRAFEETDVMEARLLSYVVAHGGAARWASLLEALGLESSERLEAAADGLESLGLAIIDKEEAGWTLWTPESVRRNVPLPLPVRHKLQPTLERYEAPALQQIAATLGLTSPGNTSRAARASAIARILLNPDGLQSVTERISNEAAAILDFVIRRGGVTNLHELGLKLDTRRRNQLYSYDWSYRWYVTSPRNPVEELLSCGLLVMEGAVGFHYGAILIAGDLLALLTGKDLISGSLPPLATWESVPAEGLAIRGSQAIGRDMALLFAHLNRNPTGRTGKGIIHRTALKNLAKSLTVPTVAFAGFLYAIARESGLIAPDSRHDHYDLTPLGEEWLALEAEDQRRALFRTWRGQRRWVETAPDPLVEEGVFVDINDVKSVRETILSLFKEFSAHNGDRLLTVASLTECARYRRWAFFPPDRPEEEAGEERSSESLTGKELVERIAEALLWLGLLEVTRAPSGKIDSLRLTSIGRAVVLGEPAPEARAEADRFVVQPNLEIYAPPDLKARLYFDLFRIAEPKGDGMLALSADSIRKALDRGLTTAEVLELLCDHSSTGLPQNVEYLVREVGGKHGHIRVGAAGLYVVVDDPILLKELAAQSKLGIHVRKQLSDTVALVTGDSVDSVLKQLRLAGYLPVADRESSVRAGGQDAEVDAAAFDHGESPAAILAAIDWRRLAEAPEPPSANPSSLAASTSEEIRMLVEIALEKNLRLQYASTPEPTLEEIVTVEPVGLAGSLMRVYVPARRHFGILNLSQMRWCRLTDETFEPRPEPAANL